RFRGVRQAGGHPAGAGDGPRGGRGDEDRQHPGEGRRGGDLLLRPRRQGLLRGGPPARRNAVTRRLFFVISAPRGGDNVPTASTIPWPGDEPCRDVMA